MIRCPWEEINETPLVELPDYEWITQLFIQKEIPLQYLQKPSEVEEKQVKAVCEYLLGSRNFMLLVSQDTSHTMSIYFWLCGVWAATTQKSFEIVVPTNLDPFDNEYQAQLKKMKSCELLILPYTDPTDYSLRRTKNALGGVLSERKARHKPTIMDVFSRKNPDSNDLKELVDSLIPVFGEQCGPILLDEGGTSKIIKIRSK